MIRNIKLGSSKFSILLSDYTSNLHNQRDALSSNLLSKKNSAIFMFPPFVSTILHRSDYLNVQKKWLQQPSLNKTRTSHEHTMLYL